MNDDLILAIAYYRMSSDEQTASIARQQGEVRPWATAHGYKIVREYFDEGKSGSKDQEKRLDFRRMLNEIPELGVRAVICWDAARFTRLDILDGADSVIILRDNHVQIATVKEGIFDPSMPEGRWKLMAYGENNSVYSRNLSKDSLSGRQRAAEAGYWAVGPVPYGYDRLLVDLQSGKSQLVRRTERVSKGRNVRCKLAVNQEEAEVVRWIYQEYLADRSVRQIAVALNERKISVPADWYRRSAVKAGWTWDCVKGILSHRAYTGASSIGHGRAKAKKVFNRVRPTAKEGAWEAIVPIETWQEAQDKRKRGRREKRKPHSERAGVLSGSVYCGNCGYRLCKKNRAVYYCADCGANLSRQRKPVCRACGSTKKEKRSRVIYTCNSSSRIVPGCLQWSAWEDEILPAVVRKLVEEVDTKLLDAIRASPKKPGPGASVKSLDDQAKTIRARYQTALDRCMDPKTPRELVQDFLDKANKLKSEVQAAEERIQLHQALENQGGIESFMKWWDSVHSNLLLIAEKTVSRPGRTDCLGTITTPDGEVTLFVAGAGPRAIKVSLVGEAKPSRDAGHLVADDNLRGLLRRLGCEVRLFWKPINRRLYELDQGRIALNIVWHGGGSENDVQGCTSNSLD